MKIALAQINTTVGDFPGNLKRVRSALEDGRRAGVDLVVFPEQTLPGYPAEDLLEREDFLRACEQAFAEAVGACCGIAMVIGTLTRAAGETGNPVYNSAVLVNDGRVVGTQHKTLLPTYDVFDEGRYFRPGDAFAVLPFKGRKLGLAICEDLWNDADFWPSRRYSVDPASELAARGAEMIVGISASPFSLGRVRFRYQMLSAIARRHSIPIVYSNLVGGNTTLIFDGGSLALDGDGALRSFAPTFEECFHVFEEDESSLESTSTTSDVDVLPDCLAERGDDGVPEVDVGEAYRALVLGTRDYMQKSGFQKAVIGLSGGIDSGLTAVIAADAIGAGNVTGISMPSRYSSAGSRTDARQLAEALGIHYHELPIENMFKAAIETLEPLFSGLAAGVAEENVQARIRGLLLMAISNKMGALLLSTGNKSELAVGYCTLYGDMSGGLAVISDVPKTLVYRMSRWVNRERELIPENTIRKPPSAELRPDQRDEDSLPPYEVLDPVLEAYIEQRASAEQIVALGFDSAVVGDVLHLVDRNDYKRKQAAPGLRITGKAFGPGRRFPIVQRFRR